MFRRLGSKVSKFAVSGGDHRITRIPKDIDFSYSSTAADVEILKLATAESLSLRSLAWYKGPRNLRPYNCDSKTGTRFIHHGRISLLQTGNEHEANTNLAAAADKTSQQVPVQAEESYKKHTYDAEKTVTRLYQTYPQLQDYDKNEITRYLEFMSSYAIAVDNAIEMLLKYPKFLKISGPKFVSTMATFRGIGLTEKQSKELLFNQPGLVELSRNHIAKRISFLKSYLTTAETTEIIMKCTEALTHNESIVKRKLDYLIKSMSHETKLIVSCRALSYSLTHMQMRHQFLTRAGLYKPIPYAKMIKVLEKEKASKTRRQKYFSPAEIVCFSDTQFLRSCTKGSLSINELAAFEEIFAKELENKTYDDLDEDEDNDLSDSEDEDEAESGNIRNSENFKFSQGEQFYF